MRAKKQSSRLGHYGLLTIAGLCMIFPYVWMLLSALKTKQEIFSGALLPLSPKLSSFFRVIFETPLLKYMFNSVYISFFIVGLQLLGAILAAYVFVRMNKKWVGACFLLVMATYMLPAAATYVPSYVLISDMKLMDTHLGYIISESISIFGIFFLRQAFMQVPKDVVNAAKLDGAGHLRLIFSVYIPYCRNSIASLVLINFIYSYNNYMWPSLLIKSSEKMVATVGLRQLFMQQAGYGTDWPLAMAACTISLLPMFLLLIIGNKKIIQSMANLYVNK